ncbi:MAG: SURF1 family protein [Pseudorhodoplanes sp.]
MNAGAAHRPRGIVVPVIFAGLAFLLFVALGTWQVERKAWKADLIARITQRFEAAPQPLPPERTWTVLDATQAEYRRVAFRARFLPPPSGDPRDAEARVYSAGSGLRDDVKGPGYFVFAPAKLSDGSIVVINRGFVPGSPSADSQPQARPEGEIEIVGILRWPEQRGWFVPAYDPKNDLWYARSLFEMTSQKRWETTAPFYVEQESPMPAGGIPKPAALKPTLPDNHLQYALTWYGLAAVVVVMAALWFRRRRAI